MVRVLKRYAAIPWKGKGWSPRDGCFPGWSGRCGFVKAPKIGWLVISFPLSGYDWEYTPFSVRPMWPRSNHPNFHDF